VRQTKELVSIPLGVTVEAAVNLMREHDISQVPVIEGGEVVGGMSEARILDILVSDPNAKTKPVAEYMEKPYPILSEDASLTELADRMDRETPAILVKMQGGYDIITKSDLIFFLTKQDGAKLR
jgi:cystathionine beta-synthase